SSNMGFTSKNSSLPSKMPYLPFFSPINLLGWPNERNALEVTIKKAYEKYFIPVFLEFDNCQPFFIFEQARYDRPQKCKLRFCSGMQHGQQVFRLYRDRPDSCTKNQNP